MTDVDDVKRYDVKILPAAEQALEDIEFDLLLKGHSMDEVTAYGERALKWCDTLDTFPHRGKKRDDLMPGLRTKKATGTNIHPAWVVDDATLTVVVTNFYPKHPPNTPMDEADPYTDQESDD